MSKLDLIIGPMFSGKSSELIRRIRQFKSIGKRVLITKPQIDTRYDSGKLCSHNLESIECKILSKLSEISEDEIKNYDVLIVDEGQFFPDLLETVKRWIDKLKIHIVVGGLDGDFKRNPIGQILNLIPLADNCLKLNSLCAICKDGTEAPFSHRSIKSEESTVLVGGAESYIPVCRKHFIELN